VTERYHIPARLDPTRSLLGLLLCPGDEDRLRCQNRFYLLAIGGLVGYLVIIFLAWAWINMGSAPTEQDSQAFWTLQTALLGGVILLSWIGFRPSIRVDLSEDGVCIKMGRKPSIWLRAESLRSASRIDARVHHQHYRLYAETRSFIGAPHQTFVLIRTEEQAWVLGVSPAEQNGLVESINELLAENRANETLVA